MSAVEVKRVASLTESGIFGTSNVSLNCCLLDLACCSLGTSQNVSSCFHICGVGNMIFRLRVLCWHELHPVYVCFTLFGVFVVAYFQMTTKQMRAWNNCLLHLQETLLILKHWCFRFLIVPWGIILRGKANVQLKWEEGRKGANVFLGSSVFVLVCTWKDGFANGGVWWEVF